jgi:hypothetical protein
MWKESYLRIRLNKTSFVFLLLGLSQNITLLLYVFSGVSYTPNSLLQLRFYQFLPTVPSETVEIDVILHGLKKLQKNTAINPLAFYCL